MPFFWFLLSLLATAGLTALGPQEESLGSSVRIVYLHGSWALTAEAVLCLSALAGLAALILGRRILHRMSEALGRTGMFFWLTYLPLSLWAMQANWNGLFLSEPRFRVAVIFAVTGLLLPLGLAMLGRPVVASLLNLLFFIALRIGLWQANYVMHPPPSPIFNSGIFSLEAFFVAVILLNLVAAFFMTIWWMQKQP